jgi:hypothetical protein
MALGPYSGPKADVRIPHGALFGRFFKPDLRSLSESIQDGAMDQYAGGD